MMLKHDNRPEESVEEIHLALLQAISDGMCFVDLRGAIRFWNDAAELVTGFSVAEAVCARHHSDIFFLSEEDGRAVSWTSIAGGTLKSGHFYLRHKDGHAVAVSARSLAVRRQNQEPLGTLVLFCALNSPGEPKDRASHFPRAEDRDALSLLHWSPESARPTGLLVIQIDHFPDLAQRLGHEAAERLLTMVERTVEQCLRPDEDSLRLPGGVILVTLGSGTSLTGLGNKLLGLIQSARLQWWGETVTITTSIGGAAVGPHDTMADTVRRAEDCALRASESGGSQMVLATS